jgi:hypothetical protein
MTGLDTIGDSGNILLTDTSEPDQCCEDLLGTENAQNRAELTVSFPKAQAEKTGFGSTAASQPARRGIISVGDVLRSTTKGPDFTSPLAMDAIENPANLQALGTSISKFCERWDREGFDIVLCFDSLTELLEHTSPSIVFQFCHVLNRRLASVDALAHFHLDPDAHDDQTVATFQSIFDSTVGETTDANAIEEFVEATDGDIAAMADTWGEEASYSIVGDGEAERTDEIREASDEEIADLLGG